MNKRGELTSVNLPSEMNVYNEKTISPVTNSLKFELKVDENIMEIYLSNSEKSVDTLYLHYKTKYELINEQCGFFPIFYIDTISRPSIRPYDVIKDYYIHKREISSFQNEKTVHISIYTELP